MIRKLRLKFVVICMTMVTAVLAVVLCSNYSAVVQNTEDLSRKALRQVLQEDGRFRPQINITIGNDRVLLPYFTLEAWGNAVYVTGGTYADLEDTEALKNILSECLAQKRPEGVISSYNLRYLRRDNGLYQKIAFVDTSMERAILREMLWSYLQISIAALILLLGMSMLLARWATAPVERAWRQQRQFLSDASHELKTPLTVILSNAELLSLSPLEDRPARWTDNIHSEAARMQKLVEEMLTLARADDVAKSPILEESSLSDIAEDCALSFEPVAFEAGKPLVYQIDEAVTVLGDEEKLRRLVSILLDNAIKYGLDGGTITMTLQKTDRQARLTVSNRGDPIPPEKLDRLFERFYRADPSRGETSGFGLGLSIGAVIAAEHRGVLKAESDIESTRFIFTLPLKK